MGVVFQNNYSRRIYKRNSELDGQLTVMAALCFGIIVSLMVVMIESAFIAGAKVRINTITNLSVQSLFSHYSAPLHREYEIFGGVIYEDEKVRQLLYEEINNNLRVNKAGQADIKGIATRYDPYGIKVNDISISELKKLSDDGGKYFANEITSYMKLGILAENNENYLEQLKDIMKQEDVKPIDKELLARQKEASKIDALILKLLMHVEGIKTNSSGFSTFFGKLSSRNSFVKKICGKGTGFGCTGVDNRQVYDCVSGEYFDIVSELSSLKGELDFIVFIYNHPLTKGLFNDMGFRLKAWDIYNEISSAISETNKSLSIIEDINDKTTVFIGNLSKSEAVLESKRGTIKDSVHDSYRQEFEELHKYDDKTANELCDVNDVKNKLTMLLGQLSAMQESVGILCSGYMDIETIGSMYGNVDSSIAICSQYSADEIKFNYSNIKLGKGSELSHLEKVKGFYENGLLSLVIKDASDISKQCTSITDLSSSVCKDLKGSANLNLLENFLYNKYITSYFNSYLSPNEKGLLKYEKEYILGNTQKDKENLSKTVEKIINLRFLSNLTCIMCDSAKKAECLEMATIMLGFTGVVGVIKAGQYLLLSAWAYGEAVADTKALLDGKKVNLVKTQATWKTDLQSIVDQTVNSSVDSDPGGLNYDAYLELLLSLLDERTKIYRTMDIMEIHMSGKGYAHIRMYKYLYSLKVECQYTYRKNKYDYTQNVKFAYE